MMQCSYSTDETEGKMKHIYDFYIPVSHSSVCSAANQSESETAEFLLTLYV